MNTTLTIEHLQDQRLDRALDELLANVRRAAVAGHAREALVALGWLLQREGAWRLPAHGALVTEVQRLWPLVALLAGQGCPAVGEQQAMDAVQLAEWADEQAGQWLQSLALPGRQQRAPGGGRRGRSVRVRPRCALARRAWRTTQPGQAHALRGA